MTAAPDPIVEAVREKLRSRSELGIAKYGATLAGNPLPLSGWLVHAQEEVLDLANYLERSIVAIGEFAKSSDRDNVMGMAARLHRLAEEHRAAIEDNLAAASPGMNAAADHLRARLAMVCAASDWLGEIAGPALEPHPAAAGDGSRLVREGDGGPKPCTRELDRNPGASDGS